MNTFSDSSVRWFVALSVAAVQNGVALFAVYSSSQDRLSDGACIGGVFGTQANLVILAVVVVWSIVLAVQSSNKAKRHEAAWYRGSIKPHCHIYWTECGAGLHRVAGLLRVLIGLCNARFELPIQPTDATHSSNFSAGEQ